MSAPNSPFSSEAPETLVNPHASNCAPQTIDHTLATSVTPICPIPPFPSLHLKTLDDTNVSNCVLPTPTPPTALGLNVALLNTLSLVKHATELSALIADEELDLLAVTETWLHDAANHAAQLATPDNFDIIRADRPNNKGGGVALIHRKSLDLHVVASPEILECEHLLVKLQVNPNVSICFLLVYRPPHKMLTFEEQLLNIVLSHLKSSSHFMILGDFNYHYNDPSDPPASSLIAALHAIGFSQIIQTPTHKENNILDWVLCFNSPTSIPSILPCPWSDHHLILFQLEMPVKPKRSDSNARILKKCRNLKLVSPTNFDSIATPLLQALPLSDDLETLVDQYLSVTSTCLNQLAPEKNRWFKSETIKKTWFDDNIVLLRKAKRSLERAWRKHPSTENLLLYKDAAKLYKDTIVTAKKDDFNTRIKNSRSNSKALFGILKELEGKKRSVDEVVRDDAWCASIQNALLGKVARHRANICTRQAASLNSTVVSHTQHPPVSPPFNFKQVSESEVFKIVSRMKPTSCRGDICPAEIILGSLHLLLPMITKIVNLSFSSSSVPPVLKHSWISPLLKKAGLDASDPGNYRPITSVPFLLKILDCIAFTQIQAYLEEYHLLGRRQSGFRARFGTETALVDLKTNISKLIDSGSPVLLMLLDLSAAFDLVDHAILLDRLQLCTNFSGAATNWVSSFLRDRSVRVFSGDAMAPPATQLYGVPQGSCLSPTIYNVYTRPLFDLLDDLGVGYTNYADDTQVFLKLSGDYDSDSDTVSRIFTAIQDWMTANFLVLNDSKTELLVLGTRQKLAKLSPDYKHFLLAGCSIPVLTSVKTLGVYFDAQLNMKKHVSHLHSSCSYLVKLLFQIRPYLTKENLSLLACALINSRLDYCNALLAGTSSGNLEKLQRTQNGAVRAVCGLKRRDHVSHARMSLHWLPVRKRILHKTLTLTFKCRSGLAPEYLADCLRAIPPRRLLRSNSDNLLQKPPYKLEGFGGSSFHVQAPLAWNKLPSLLRITPTLLKFKKDLKTFLFKDTG